MAHAECRRELEPGQVVELGQEQGSPLPLGDLLEGTLFVDRLRGLQKDLIVRKIKKLSRAGKW